LIVDDPDEYLRRNFDTFLCFNDQEYIQGMPGYEFPRYWLGGVPLFTVGRIYLEKELEAGVVVSGTVAEVPGHGDTSIWNKWGVQVFDPEGSVVAEETVYQEDEVAFSFVASVSGVFEMKIRNAGYDKLVELRIKPADWTFIRGENGSREAH